jgi:hypothetical protein
MTTSMLMRDLEKGRPVKVSSDFSFFGAFLSLAIAILFSIVIFNSKVTGLPIVIYIVLLGLCIFQFVYVSNVILEGDKLIIKKLFRKTEVIFLSQIVDISTFKLKSTKYTFLKYNIDEYKDSKALILNSNSVLFGKQDTLKDLLEYTKTKHK